jgi:hypothetical protein
LHGWLNCQCSRRTDHRDLFRSDRPAAELESGCGRTRCPARTGSCAVARRRARGHPSIESANGSLPCRRRIDPRHKGAWPLPSTPLFLPAVWKPPTYGKASPSEPLRINVAHCWSNRRCGLWLRPMFVGAYDEACAAERTPRGATPQARRAVASRWSSVGDRSGSPAILRSGRRSDLRRESGFPFASVGPHRPDEIVCDAGCPKNLSPKAQMPCSTVFLGGLGQITGAWKFAPGFHGILNRHTFPDVVYGCLLEGMALAFATQELARRNAGTPPTRHFLPFFLCGSCG